MNRGGVVLMALLVACASERDRSVTGALGASGPSFDVARYSDWSAPVNLGATVNSPSVDQGASISKDGLSLYFHSTRPGGSGGADIYVSHRASVADAWGTPQNLGPVINTTANEQAPRLSRDGHRLFFNSDRLGGFGGQDLYMARRRDKRDDFGWQSPVNLGGGVNTALDETTADPFEDDAAGTNVLYFSSGPNGAGGLDIYMSTLLPDGTYGPGVPVAELNSPSLDRQPAIGRDGLEIFFASDRDGPPGNLGLFVATRATTTDPWSTPVSLGSTVNSPLIEARPAISFDGTALYFQSTRPGAVGCSSPTGPCVFDLWVTTRSRLKGPD